MKKIIFNSSVLIAFAFVMSISGCTKKDLFLPPATSLSDADAYSTADRIEKNSVGMYDQLQNANFFGGRILIYTDIRGLDAIPSTYFGNMGFFSTTSASDGTVGAAWQGGYRTIYQTNLFLKNFADHQSMVSADKANQYIGEAKFIRSLVYFYLVNLWAQPYNFTADASHLGVPLTLTATDNPFAVDNNVPRATVKQVYDQMETDLLDAESKLPLTVSDDFTKVARATKGAARALLMRMYLYKGDFAKANQYADAIINSNQYTLNNDPQSTFRAPFVTHESIFSVAMNGSDNPNTNAALGQHYGSRLRGDIPINPDYVALMDITTDKRYLNLMEKVGTTYWTTKYASASTDFVPVARYAEVLLTKAEALARTSAAVDPTALSLLNQIRTRSNAAPVVAATSAALVTAILKERRIELAFEGQGTFEFQRNKQDIPAHGIVTLQAWGTSYRVLPIPRYDTDINPNLVQNPGY